MNPSQTHCPVRHRWARNAVVAVTLVMTAGITSSSADVLRVEDAVRLALSRGRDAAAADAARLEARAALWSANAARLPHVSQSLEASASGSRVRRSNDGVSLGTTESDGRSVSTSTSVSWSLLDASTLAEVASARAGLVAAEHNRADTRASVELATRRQFWTAVKAIRIASVADSALALARDQEHRTSQQARVGAVSNADLLKARLQTSQAELDSLTAHRDAEVQRLELLKLVGLPADASATLDTTLTLPTVAPELDTLLARARASRPDLAAAEARVRAAQWALRSAQRSRWPSLTLSGSAGGGHDRSEDSPGGTTTTDTERRWSGALALTQTMFDGGSSRARIGNAQAAEQQRASERDAVSRQLETDVREAVLQWREAEQRVRVASARTNSAAENLRGDRRRYELGSATMLELVNAQVELARANQAVVEAWAALLIADAEVAYAAGGSGGSR